MNRARSRLAALALAALLVAAPASAQQAPFSLDDRFEGLLDRIDELEASAEALRAERDELRAERESLRSRALADAEARARDRDIANRLDAERARADELAAALERGTAELDGARTEAERARAETVQALADLEAIRAELDAARVEADELRADLAIARARADGATQAIAADEPVDAAPGADTADTADATDASDASAVAAGGAACGDTISSEVEGVVARLVVINPCRARERLSVRSMRPTDPLLGQLRTRFDADGRAELAFPVLEAGTRLRVLGAERGEWRDVELSPSADSGADIAVLRWEDDRVDLDLVATALDASTSLAPRAPDAPARGALGAFELVQGTDGAQLPRFEVFVAADGGPALELGVDHASRGAVAEPPWCGDSDAADPRLLLVLRRGGALEQARAALAPLPCGEAVPEGRRVTRLRTLG